MGAGGERAVALTRKEIRKLHNFRTLREKYKSLGTTYFPALANSFFVSDFGIPPISPEPRLLDRGFEPGRGFKINRLGCRPCTWFLSSFTLANLIHTFYTSGVLDLI